MTAVLLLTSGLCGMSYFSSPALHAEELVLLDYHETRFEGDDDGTGRYSLMVPFDSTSKEDRSAKSPGFQSCKTGDVEEVDEVLALRYVRYCEETVLDVQNVANSERRCCLTRYQLGLLAAIFDGLWGGSFLVPLHFSRYVEITYSPIM